MTIEKKADLIRAMAVATCIAQYKLLALKDNTHHELKQRVNRAIKSCGDVEQYFITHQEAKPQVRETFKEQFLSGEIVLMAELLELCVGLSEDDLEMIIEGIRKNIEQPVTL